MIKFEWDKQKAKSNFAKHKIAFAEASTVFEDEKSRLITDPAHSLDEDRFIIIGFSLNLRLLVVCHCYRDNDEIIRIISARKATKKETIQYEEFL